MCKRCRKRFTFKPARRELSAELGELTAELLWLEVTAARAAEFFRTIRERIAAECETELEKLKLDSIVYSDAGRPITSPHSTASTTGASTTIRPGLTANNGLDCYCEYAKRRLKSDHGGFKRNFRLFIRE